MNIPKPTKSSEYPWYTLFYGLLLWGAIILYVVVTSIGTITPDGAYTEQRDCLQTETAGRYDEQEVCVEYGEPYYVPYGSYLKGSIVRSGIMIAIASVLVGGYMTYQKKKEEDREREQDDNFNRRIDEAVQKRNNPNIRPISLLLNKFPYITDKEIEYQLELSPSVIKKTRNEIYEEGLAYDLS